MLNLSIVQADKMILPRPNGLKKVNKIEYELSSKD
jgi:hypothetical protein